MAVPIVLLLCASAAPAQTTHLRVQEVVKQFVQQTGNQVLGLGSWIEGGSYNPLTSDHDMRLLLPTGTGDAQALKRWTEARRQLVSMLQKEFGPLEAQKVLARTNLYPPSQLMRGVEDSAEALARFQKLQTVPNLGYQGVVGPSTHAKYAEGLYGEGSKAFTQFYERTKGRLFYQGTGGRCMMGMTDLTHFSEGVARFTIDGTAHTATQWTAHAAEELAAGRGEKVAKYLERISRDLMKSRDLARLPTNNVLRGELDALQKLLKADPGMLLDKADDVQRLLMKANMEASVLRNYANSGPMGRVWQRLMLEGIETQNQVGRLLSRAYEAAGGAAVFDRMVAGMVITMATYKGALAYDEGGKLEALRAAGPIMVSLASLPVSLLAELTNEIMKEAEASGYVFAANSQEAWDLMGGVYTGLGRGSNEDDPRRVFSLEQLVAGWHQESRLSSLVFGQCLRAAARGQGGVTVDADLKVATAMFEKCWPPIRDAWRMQREMLTYEYLQLASEVVHTPLLMTYSPAPLKIDRDPVRALIDARSRDGKFAVRTERMEEIMRRLCGKRAGVAVDYEWTPGGRRDPGMLLSRQTYSFDSPGVYPITLRVKIRPYSPVYEPPAAARVMLPREIGSVVDVIVEGPEPEPTGDGAWVYRADPAEGWTVVSPGSEAPNRNYAQRVRDRVAQEPDALALETDRIGEVRIGNAKYQARTYGVLLVGPRPWFTALSFGEGAETAANLGGNEGVRLAETTAVTPAMWGSLPGAQMVEPGKIAPYLRTHRIAFETRRGEAPLAVGGFVGVEVTPKDPAMYDLETLLQTTGPAFDAVCAELEAMFATAGYARAPR